MLNICYTQQVRSNPDLLLYENLFLCINSVQ